MNETIHSLIANRVELSFHEIIDITECLVKLLSILCHILFELVPESANKSKIIFKFDDQSLVVYCKPVTIDCFSIAMACIATLAESSLSGEVRFDKDGPSVILLHGKLVISANDLNLVWHAMSAYLMLIK